MRAALLLLVTGCAAAPTPRAPANPAPGAVIAVPRVVVTPTRTASLPELFAEAVAREQAGQLEGAALGFERVAALEPDGELAGEALFRAGDIHDRLGNHQAAIDRYRILVERHLGHARSRTATLRLVRLCAYVEDFTWAGRFADRLLAQRDLRPIEAIVAYGGKALAMVDQGDDTRAASYVERGRDIVEREQLDLAGRLPRDLAPLYYALGETQRLRAERIRFDPIPQDFSAVLESRCQLILDAQHAYSDTWRAYDAHWSTLAGYRLGEMYESLHRDLMAMPKPVAADTDARRQLFEGAMRLRYEVLLEKARGMLEHTVAMAEREGERSAWVERAKRSLLDIRAAEAAEQAALDRLPYSRADLEEALAEIKKRAASRSKAQGPTSK